MAEEAPVVKEVGVLWKRGEEGWMKTRCQVLSVGVELFEAAFGLALDDDPARVCIELTWRDEWDVSVVS